MTVHLFYSDVSSISECFRLCIYRYMYMYAYRCMVLPACRTPLNSSMYVHVYIHVHVYTTTAHDHILFMLSAIYIFIHIYMYMCRGVGRLSVPCVHLLGAYDMLIFPILISTQTFCLPIVMFNPFHATHIQVETLYKHIAPSTKISI